MHLALKTIILNLMMEMLSLMQTGCFFLFPGAIDDGNGNISFLIDVDGRKCILVQLMKETRGLIRGIINLQK